MCIFSQCLGPANTLNAKGCSEVGPFRPLSKNIHNFGNTEAMRLIFFLNCSKFYRNFKTAKEIWQKAFCFFHSCIWIACVKFLSSAVNELTSSPRIPDLTKRDIFELNLSNNDEIAVMYFQRLIQIQLSKKPILFFPKFYCGPFRHFGNHAFRKKSISHMTHLWGWCFFNNAQNIRWIAKLQWKFAKKNLVS